MSIFDDKCDVCQEELNTENYYYIYSGRMQQSVHSDPKATREFKLCTNCYNRISAELLASVMKYKLKHQEEDKPKA